MPVPMPTTTASGPLMDNQEEPVPSGNGATHNQEELSVAESLAQMPVSDDTIPMVALITSLANPRESTSYEAAITGPDFGWKRCLRGRGASSKGGQRGQRARSYGGSQPDH